MTSKSPLGSRVRQRTLISSTSMSAWRWYSTWKTTKLGSCLRTFYCIKKNKTKKNLNSHCYHDQDHDNHQGTNMTNTGRLVRSGRMRVGASLAQAGPWYEVNAQSHVWRFQPGLKLRWWSLWWSLWWWWWPACATMRARWREAWGWSWRTTLLHWTSILGHRHLWDIKLWKRFITIRFV